MVVKIPKYLRTKAVQVLLPDASQLFPRRSPGTRFGSGLKGGGVSLSGRRLVEALSASDYRVDE